MSRRIVGLCGYAKSGKDTAAEVLVRRGWARYAFADELKADLERAIGKPLVGMCPEEKEHWRPLMVEYGRVRRAQNVDYWVARLA